jgi:hypothetical protein
MLLPDLIERLETLRAQITNDLGERAVAEAEIRLAVNPAWATQHVLADTEEITWAVEEDTWANDQQVVAYLADGGQVPSAPYLPSWAEKRLGWS